ncbi:unnamed protein product [Spirodela intermedia]|uniref:Uncharacterized protein n=1 Tax=Spirodela intermedia TaxID=51605 RepID=A0A7I8LKB4_SPIIN|nr:unnamed protein product [Spirodela intermedia]
MIPEGTIDEITKPDPLPITVDPVKQCSSPNKENPSISRQVSDSEEREVSDDEDDDRNHKHRRRDNRSQPLEEDAQGQFARQPIRKRNKPYENGQQFAEREPQSVEIFKEYSPFSERDSSSSSEKRRHVPVLGNPMDFGQKTRMGRGFRPNNSSRFDSTTLVRPSIGGRGRGASSWNQHDARFNPLDPLGFASQVPSLLGAGFSSTSSAQSTTWGSYGFIPGMTNGCLDPLHPLNLQGALHPSINSVNVGMARQRCRDFEERGFCLRGDMCPMEHGMNRIVVEDVQSLSQFNLPVSLPTTNILGAQAAVGPLPPVTSSSFLTNSKSAPNKTTKSGMTNNGSGVDGAMPGPAPGVEADVYDPDQPLWNNDRPETSGACLRLPSPSTEDVGTLWEAGSSGHHNFILSASTSSDQHSLSAGDHPSGPAAPPVWGRVRSGSNLESTKKTFNTMTSSVYIGNGMKKETEESLTNSLSASGQVKHAALDGSVPKTAKLTDTDAGRKLGKASQKAQRTLFVNGIPQKNNRREALVSHFQKFGEIIDIYIPVSSEKAFVQFSKREEAEAALKSPDAVMGNRFIKLWWANRDNIPDGEIKGHTTPVAVQSTSTPVQLQAFVRDRGESKTSIAPKAFTVAPVGGSTPASILQKPSTVGGPKVTPLVQSKMESLESMKEELRKKQESLKQKRDDFKRQLEKLQKQNFSINKNEVVTERPAKKLKTDEDAEVTKASTPRPANSNIVGGHQEPEKPQDKGSSRETIVSPSSKLSMTLVQQSPRSLKLAGHSPGLYANRFKIDNRPTAFKIISPLPDDLASVAALKEHFSAFGDLAGIELDASETEPCDSGSVASSNRSALVTFTTRRSAEKAFSSAISWQGHSLQFAWLIPTSSSNFAHNAGEISTSKISKGPSDASGSSSLISGTQNSIAVPEGGGGMDGGECAQTEQRDCAGGLPADNLARVSPSSPLSNECEERPPQPDAPVVEDHADVGLAE